MTPSSSVPLLLVLACTLGLGVLAQELDVSVSVFGNEVDIDIEEHDPCEAHQCPTGEECVSVFSPQLMQLPVAHCVQSQNGKNEESGPCVEYEVSSNILSCKTENDWKRVGNHQCMLRDNQTPVLTKTQVQYACHNFESSPTPTFLSATFTCCSVDYTLTTNKLPPSAEEPHPSEEPQTDGVQYEPKPPVPVYPKPGLKDKETWSDIHTYIIPLVLGAMLIIGVVAILLAVWQRRRSVRQRKSQKPRMVFATSFVNPNADHSQMETDWVINPLDSTDKSLLIANELSFPGK